MFAFVCYFDPSAHKRQSRYLIISLDRWDKPVDGFDSKAYYDGVLKTLKLDDNKWRKERLKTLTEYMPFLHHTSHAPHPSVSSSATFS
jgi:hypothetical protein